MGWAATLHDEEQLGPKNDLRGTMVGSWKIVGLLGKGGMGKVYAAKDPVSGAQVAVKVLDLDNGALDSFPAEERRRREGEFRERFLREAQVASKVGRNQPNIIQILTYGRIEDDRPYFVMEFLHGHSLADRIAKDPPRGAELRRLLEHVCDALMVIHRAGVQHRDLKPENIWVSEPEVGVSSAKVLDFGLSKLEGASNLTRPGETMGSVHYMSPEQAQARSVDERSDIYAFGSVLREIVTGKRLFDEPGRSEASVLVAAVINPPPPLVPRPGFVVSPEFAQLIADCLGKKPEQRPQTMAEVKARLMSALDACANCEGPVTSAAPTEAPSLQKTMPSLPVAPLSLQKTVQSSRPVTPASRAASQASPFPTTEVLLPSAMRRSRVAWLLVMCLVGLGVVAAVAMAGRRTSSPAAAAVSPPSPIALSPVVPDTRPTPPAATPLAVHAPAKVEPAMAKRSPSPAVVRPARAAGRPSTPTQPMEPPSQPALEPAPRVPAPPAEIATPTPPAVRGSPIRALEPAFEAPKPSRQLTPSERDLITDKDLLLK